MALEELRRTLERRFEIARSDGRHPDDFRKAELYLIQYQVQNEELSESDSATVRAWLDELCDQLPVPLATDAAYAAATSICQSVGRKLTDDADVRTLIQTWPAPIAHELLALIEALQGTVDGNHRRVPSPESALLQLRDLIEILLRVPSIALARALIDMDGEEAQWAFSKLITASGGNWMELARGAAQRLLNRAPAHPLNSLAGLFASHTTLRKALDSLLAARNDYLGHSGVRPDPEETAGIVRWFVIGGKDLPKGEKHLHTPPATLLAGLKDAVQRMPWHGIELVMVRDDAVIPLTGAQALRGWFGDPRRHEHDGRTLPVQLVFGTSSHLSLSPWISVRQCSRCDMRDVFVYDTLYSSTATDLQDYGRGHKIRIKLGNAPDIDTAILGPLAGGLPAGIETDRTGVDSVEISTLLDRQRVDLRYQSPAYLRHRLADFINAHEAGVYWLEAPAHVGKTTFVQGLVLPELREGDLAKSLAPGNGVVAFFCKKEYRDGGPGFVSAIEDGLKIALKIRIENVPIEARPEAKDVARAADRRLAFAQLIQDWRNVSPNPAQPVLIIIDGLDEADQPASSRSLFDYLPRPDALSSGVFVLLTSRRIGDADCPDWLGPALAPVIAGTPECYGHHRLSTRDSEYIALLRTYAAYQLVRKIDEPAFEALFEQILTAAEGLFVYLSFIVDQLRGGRIKPQDLADGRLGVQHYDHFLQSLSARYQPKLADDLRLILAALAAAESAHEWLFDEGARPDLALAPEQVRRQWITAYLDGEPLPKLAGAPMLDIAKREWAGIDLDLLAEAVDMDLPPDREGRARYRARFIILLFLLQGALGVWRGAAGTPRYRIGLKGLAQRLSGREEFVPLLQRMHLRLAGLTLDAVESLQAVSETENFQPTASAAWPRVDAGFLTLLGHQERSGSELLRARWAATEPAILAWRVAHHFSAQYHLEAAVRWYSVTGHLISGFVNAETVSLANALAGAYSNRGLAKRDATEYGAAAAIGDYDAAIAILEALRAQLEPHGRGEAKLRNDLAGAYVNRGNAKRDATEYGAVAAIGDYDAAIAILEELRAQLEPQDRWEAELRNDLAGAYVNRGVAKRDATEYGAAAAIGDYDAAIAILEALRARLEPHGRGEAKLRNDLASAYVNRGVAKRDATEYGAVAAIGDYLSDCAPCFWVHRAVALRWSSGRRVVIGGRAERRVAIAASVAARSLQAPMPPGN
jgi:hypothetical protein